MKSLVSVLTLTLLLVLAAGAAAGERAEFYRAIDITTEVRFV